MPKLNDIQSILLACAAQRDTGSLLPLPDTLSTKAASAGKAITTLVKHGFAQERETNDKTAVCRSDGNLSFGVFVTSAGLAAIGIELDTQVGGDDADGADGADGTVAPAPAVVSAEPQPRVTKVASVIILLKRTDGATLAELITATGWLPHTTRAALTGLRKKGHAITRGTRDGVTCYTMGAVA